MLPQSISRAEMRLRKATKNTFDIVIDGNAVEECFSAARQSNYFPALRKRYSITNLRDKIEIRFPVRNGKSLLNGIKLRKLY